MQAPALIAVVRVISDNHKDEIACITLAPETLHEERSFFAVVNTREKGFRHGNVEADLQTINLMLADRVWFGFDIELAEKTIRRLFESANQSPPQHIALWEAFHIVESTFSWSCNSVAQVAESLQIAPWTQRISNARTECDITCEVLSRIALSTALRQWTVPVQDYTNVQKPAEEQLDESQEILAASNEATEDQSMLYQPATNAIGDNGRDIIPSQQELDYNSPNNDIDTNVAQTTAEDTNVNSARDVMPSDFTEDNANIEQYEHAQSFAETSLHGQKVYHHHANFTDVQGGDQHRDQNYDFSGHNVDNKPSESKNAGVDHSQTNYDSHRSYVGGGQASWKDLAKGKQSTSSPSRPSHLHVIPGIVSKKGDDQGKGKGIRDPQLIKQHINNAMASNKVLWISYDGGMQPLAPRGVTPTKWENPGSETAFLGIPYNSKTNQERKFYLRDVREVRDKSWFRQEDGKPNRFGKRKNHQGKSREERQNNGTNSKLNTADTTTNNAATSNNRAKQKRQHPRDNKKSTLTSNAPGKSTQQTK